MITVRLMGGLGNQMFQYAMARSLAHRRSAALALDVSSYPDNFQRTYSLGVFKIVAKPTSGGLMRIGPLRGLCSRARIPLLPRVVLEKGMAFDPSVLDTPSHAYLVGHWASEKYFSDVEDVIRRELAFQQEPVGRNAEIAARIRGVNSVSVHVRRTDYVSNAGANKVHGTCSLDYYREAARLAASGAPNPEFFVFSDEPEWARANLTFEGPVTFVTHNSIEKGHEDLRLMALCRSHIIANSTFSWWGAWLSHSPGIVVAPRKWFNAGALDASDLVPARWVRV